MDASLDFDSAYALTLGTDAGDTLCPRRDADYWRVEMIEGDLLLVDLTYQKLANMQLAVDWYGPVGACIPAAPTSCAESANCQAGETCDLARGGCRRIALDELCIQDSHCQSGEVCAAARQKIATVLEPSGSSSLHRVVTTFASRMAGTYYLVVRDNLGQVSDSSIEYTLTTTGIADPDALNEINDARNLATPITSGTPIEGYLAQRGGFSDDPTAAGDVDWFMITPSFATAPIALVELTWPEQSALAPTFTLYQEDFAYESSKVSTTGSGNDATNTRRATFVLPSTTAPIYVRVTDTAGTYDLTNPYTLTVTLSEDTNEGALRNDTPDDAVVMSLASAGTTVSPAPGTIVAQNDQDWYRVDRAGSDNALVRVLLDARTTSDYLLQLNVFVPSGQSCTDSGDCTGGGQCLEDHTCITPWVTRPSPDGPGDPQLGGLSPNYIDTQLPLFASGDGAMYLLVTHLAATPLAIPGYGPVPYQLTATHKAEPDAEDLTNPDNTFVARPLEPGLERWNFFDHARELTVSSTSGGDGGAAFVAIAPESLAVVGTCNPIDLLAMNEDGTTASGATTVSFSEYLSGDTTPVSLSLVYSDDACTTNVTSGHTISGAQGTIYVNPTAAHYVSSLTTTVGGVSAQQALAAVANADVASISLTTEAGGAMPRRLVRGSTTRARISLPVGAPAGTAITLQVSGLSVACAEPAGAACPNVPSGASSPCLPALTADWCNLYFAAGQQDYDIMIQPVGTSLAIMRAVHHNATYASANLVASVQNPITMNVTGVTGYISYEGDQDFFTLPVPGLVGSGLTLTANMPESPVDLRITASRGYYGASIGDEFGEEDQCATAPCALSSATCNTRKTCDNPERSRSVGPEATGEAPRCIYIDTSADTIEVWVNDLSANDGDELNPYTFSLTISEGCPALCSGQVSECP